MNEHPAHFLPKTLLSCHDMKYLKRYLSVYHHSWPWPCRFLCCPHIFARILKFRPYCHCLINDIFDQLCWHHTGDSALSLYPLRKLYSTTLWTGLQPHAWGISELLWDLNQGPLHGNLLVNTSLSEGLYCLSQFFVFFPLLRKIYFQPFTLCKSLLYCKLLTLLKLLLLFTYNRTVILMI